MKEFYRGSNHTIDKVEHVGLDWMDRLEEMGRDLITTAALATIVVSIVVHNNTYYLY